MENGQRAPNLREKEIRRSLAVVWIQVSSNWMPIAALKALRHPKATSLSG